MHDLCRLLFLLLSANTVSHFYFAFSCSMLTRCMASAHLEPEQEGAGRGGEDAPAAYYLDQVPQCFASGKVKEPTYSYQIWTRSILIANALI
jgi:hypothetical protein